MHMLCAVVGKVHAGISGWPGIMKRDLNQYHHLACPDGLIYRKCSPSYPHVIFVFDAQILAYDIATLELSFSVMTHPAPGSNTPGASEDERAATMPLALGPRWLAYAANQASFVSSRLHASAGCMDSRGPPRMAVQAWSRCT